MVRIDSNKPLPEHTKLRYEECYAKVFLEHFYPNEFCNLIIQDKPDLYDCKNEVGIEVVEAKEQRKKEAEKLWYTMPYVPVEKKKKNIGRMKQLGEEYTGGVQFWGTIIYDEGIDSKPFDVLYESIICKLKKLNKGNYQLCRRYELFVCSELMVIEEWNRKLLERLEELSSGYSLKYNRIYLLSQEYLCLFDIQEHKFYNVNIEKEQKLLANQARKLVEQGENE